MRFWGPTTDGTPLCTTGSSPCAARKPVPLDAWTHVAGTYDPSTGQVTLYVDGEGTTVGTLGGPLGSVDAPVRVGANDNDLDPNAFGGTLDQVALWCRALTAEEVGARAAD